MNVRELVTILKFKTDAQSMKSAENAINKIKSMMAKIKPATLRVNTGNLGTAQKSDFVFGEHCHKAEWQKHQHQNKYQVP